MAAARVRARVLRMPQAVLAAMRAHAARAYPEEACGFLLGTADPAGATKDVARAEPARNAHREQATHRFLIEPLDLLAAEERAQREGLDVVGFYHSHPSGAARPSETDRALAWPWYAYVIVAVRDGEARETMAWRLADDRSGFRPDPMVEVPSGAKEP